MSETQTPYQALGEAGIAQLVERLYHHMARLPAAAAVHAMHRGDMDALQTRLRAFLSGWLGGPERFTEAYGPPFMRRRHFAFPIDAAARDAWMLCMRHALDDVVADAALRERLFDAFMAMADHLRNRAEPGLPAIARACDCGQHREEVHT